jgi:Tol biopolymer transport system component
MAEGIGRGTDNNFGAALTQITSAALISHNIYCEERYTSADGSYIAFLRSALGQEGEELWLHEACTANVARLSEKIYGYPSSNIYSDSLFYVRLGDQSNRVLVRVDLSTLEQEEVFDLSKCPRTRYPSATVSRDDRYYVSNFLIRDNLWGLFRADLERGTWEVFHEQEEICNPHVQFEPSRGEEILVQWNRGSRVDAEQNVVGWADERGTTLYVVNRDGGNLRTLPVGKPHTGAITGHECWIGDTGKVLLSTHGDNGNEIHISAPGEEQSQLLWNGMSFDHLSVSQDGKYFVTDDMSNSRIYVGSLETGRLLPLCDSGASFGHSTQYTHPHAYMTPDNKRIIFNSDRTGTAQVWCVDVPQGFLEALSTPIPSL